MQNFQNTFETPSDHLIIAFSICTTVPLKALCNDMQPRYCVPDPQFDTEKSKVSSELYEQKQYSE